MAFPNLTSPVAQGIRVLDADPDLAAGLPPDRFEQARQTLVARTQRLPRGGWRPPDEAQLQVDGIGMLIIEGVVVRRLSLGHRSCAELLGPGDLLRPMQDNDGEAVAPFSVSWRVIEPALVALLDARFCARLVRFPDLIGPLVGRAMDRSRTLARLLAVAQLPRVDTRLTVAMWHLSERWGTVRPDGRRLPAFLSHELLGWLVGARRPSVTTALGELTQRGAVRRESDGTWLLLGPPPVEVNTPSAPAA